MNGLSVHPGQGGRDQRVVVPQEAESQKGQNGVNHVGASHPHSGQKSRRHLGGQEQFHRVGERHEHAQERSQVRVLGISGHEDVRDNILDHRHGEDHRTDRSQQRAVERGLFQKRPDRGGRPTRFAAAVERLWARVPNLELGAMSGCVKSGQHQETGPDEKKRFDGQETGDCGGGQTPCDFP